jgi:molecular chaperone DnaK (HSP70)
MIDIARLCENPLQEMLHQCTDELFHQNGGSIRKQKIKQLLLIGGGMRIPHVSHTFEHFFDQKAIQIPKGQPEEIIVKGSIQYARDHFIN